MQGLSDHCEGLVFYFRERCETKNPLQRNPATLLIPSAAGFCLQTRSIRALRKEHFRTKRDLYRFLRTSPAALTVPSYPVAESGSYVIVQHAPHL